MRVEALGDSAFIVRELKGTASLVAEALMELGSPEILDAAAAYDTVGVYTRPGGLSERELLRLMDGLELDSAESDTLHQIPVCYEFGEDTAAVCEQLRVSAEELVRLHTEPTYDCFAVGFCPGFPYLGWLPERLAGVPRRGSPRTRVEPGSVGITGLQTAVYPLPTPGGWALIGRTPLTLVDVNARYFPIRAGDRVRFSAIDASEFERLKGERL